MFLNPYTCIFTLFGDKFNLILGQVGCFSLYGTHETPPLCVPIRTSHIHGVKKLFHTMMCVRGVFGNDATWRAEGDHDMDFDIEKGVAEPKTQSRAQSLAQGLVGHFSRIFKSQSH